jgi:hypothetical protein
LFPASGDGAVTSRDVMPVSGGLDLVQQLTAATDPPRLDAIRRCGELLNAIKAAAGRPAA